MGISGKVIDGRLVVQHNGVQYPLIKSNLTAIDGYLHTGDEAYLVALATEEELARYGKTS